MNVRKKRAVEFLPFPADFMVPLNTKDKRASERETGRERKSKLGFFCILQFKAYSLG